MSSSVGTITVANGSFYIKVNGESQKIEIGSLMMAVNLGYVEELDVQIADKLSEMGERNNQIEVVTELIEFLQAADADVGIYPDQTFTVNGQTKTISEWFKYLGVDFDTSQLGIDYTSTKEEVEKFHETMSTNIESLQSALDLLNNDSETATLELQNLTEKRSNALLQASTLLKSANDATQAVLKNI